VQFICIRKRSCYGDLLFRTAAFHHKMTTRDWISQSRKLLYEMAGVHKDGGNPGILAIGVEDGLLCSLEVKRLEETMIYFLTSLPL